MKKKSLGFIALVLFLATLSFLSCKKINEATELGGDLIPAVDNVTTFELSLPATTDNVALNDTTYLIDPDPAAVGYLNDAEFGTTQANTYFSLSSSKYSTYPFGNKDQLLIDSVVLSLAYTGGYGDTTNGMQTVRVYEVSPSITIHDSAFHYTDNDVPVEATELGNKTFTINTLNDSVTLIRKKDTTKVANVLRIRLNNSLATKLASYDTTNGYKNDSIFQTLFKGLAVKADATGNALTYYDIFDKTKTKLTVYFRSTTSGVTDTSSADFVHGSSIGVASIVKRTPGSNWLTYLNNGNGADDKLYIQSAPGSYAAIKIPGLDTLTNKTIHLAELIAYRIPSMQDDILTVPPRLVLDKINNAKDSAFIFEHDQSVGSSGTVSYIGGLLKKDDSYRFNITRHVQGIATRKEPNLELRLYAPLRTILYVKSGTTASKIGIPVATKIADGRVVVAGGNYSDPNLRLRLRLVYSKL